MRSGKCVVNGRHLTRIEKTEKRNEETMIIGGSIAVLPPGGAWKGRGPSGKCVMCAFFTLKGRFHKSTSSTPRVRADSSSY